MMRKLVLLVCLYIPFLSFGQHVIEGTIFNSSGVIAQLSGDYFTYLKNNQNALAHINGQNVKEDIVVPPQGFKKGMLDIRQGVYFSKANEGLMLYSLSGEKLSNSVFSKYKPFITDNTVVEVSVSPTDQEYVYIDKTGKVLVSYDKEKYYSIFGIDITKGFYNTDSYIAKKILFSDEDFRPFSEGLIPLKHPESKLWGFADQQLSLIIPATYKKVGLFFEGKASVQAENGLWGFIDKKGNEVIPFKFSIPPSKFSSGLAKVTSKDGKIGYMDARGDVNIEPIYAYASDFYKGFALARKGLDGPIMMIDTGGVPVAQFAHHLQYLDSSAPGGPNRDQDLSFHYAETLIQLVEMGKGIFLEEKRYGILAKGGDVVLPFEYLFLKDYAKGRMLAIQEVKDKGETNRTYTIMEDTGNILIEFAESQF